MVINSQSDGSALNGQNCNRGPHFLLLASVSPGIVEISVASLICRGGNEMINVCIPKGFMCSV